MLSESDFKRWPIKVYDRKGRYIKTIHRIVKECWVIYEGRFYRVDYTTKFYDDGQSEKEYTMKM